MPRVNKHPSALRAHGAPSAQPDAYSIAVLSGALTNLLRDAETFLSLAEDALGVPGQPLLPLRSAG